MIYLDNAATTKIDPEVMKVVRKYSKEKFGNPSSLHTLGLEAKKALENSRKVIAKSINAKSQEIIFTSGGTESNNLAIKGIFFANPEKNHFITTKIDHDCIINTCKWLETQGAKVTYINVNKEGFIDLEELKKEITDKTALVSVIHGNNEIGVIQNLEEIGKICKEKGTYFHTDACQSYTKTDLDVEKQNLDLVTLNAHKIHGPKGVGALYIRKEVKITPLIHGGGQENKMRSGTENIPGIAGFATAVKISNNKDIENMTQLRDYLIKEILNKIPHTQLNGPTKENRLCNNINISFKNIEGEAIIGYLDSEKVCASTGSACSSKSLQQSHVLKAIGLSNMDANSSIRLSISRFTTKQEIDTTIEILKKVVDKLRKISPFKLD